MTEAELIKAALSSKGVALSVCPRCGCAENSKREGGNERCFHCADCGFLQCYWSSPDVAEEVNL